MTTRPQVSFILATHNRRDAVQATLHALDAARAESPGSEVIVVDNASTDGSPEAIRRSFPFVHLTALRRNLGSCAKAVGLGQAAGDYIVFLDDDAQPRPGTIARMVDRFRGHPRLAQAGFTVHLPDGRLEGAALPGVYVGAGAGFRRDALRTVGGLDRTLFMQAEEYDLSFRLLRAGFEIAVFDDLHVEHAKTAQARLSARTVYHDTRNNLIVAARYLPRRHLLPVLQDYTQRYRWIAESAGQRRAYARGRREGWQCLHAQRRRFSRWRLTGEHFEWFFRYEHIARKMTELARRGVRRVVLADLSKNIYPFVRAARRAGLQILAMADDRFARPGRSCRGCPILPVAEALAAGPDAVVISNTGPVHAAASARRLAGLTQRPVHAWFSL